MPSFFLHRISVVRVYLYIAGTTLDPAGRDLRQYLLSNFVCSKSNTYIWTNAKSEDQKLILYLFFNMFFLRMIFLIFVLLTHYLSVLTPRQLTPLMFFFIFLKPIFSWLKHIYSCLFSSFFLSLLNANTILTIYKMTVCTTI